MHKPFDEDGNELDAAFSIEPVRRGFDLVLESRGGPTGGRPARNVAYAPALRQHLERMAALGMTLVDLQVASRPAMKRPEADRHVWPDGYPLPLPLGSSGDAETLRRAIGRVVAAYDRPGPTGGNGTKRLRLRMAWSEAARLSPDAIAALLAHSQQPEAPTADQDELSVRVRRARQRMRRTPASAPAGQKRVRRVAETTDRYVRDPEVIAWVLQEASGHCECCSSPAPFVREDGEPFLEVHHVRPLGEGGPDTIDNAAACCPNCHRKLHHAADRETLRTDLIRDVSRLRDHPVSSS